MAQKLNIDIVAKDKSKQALTGVRGGLDRLKKSVFNLRNAFIGLGTGLAIRSLINTGKQIEGLQVRLKFLFGTAQEGAKAFDEMANFAAKVPFSLEEIQAGSGVLAVVSKDAKELANLMEITGNVAAVTGLDFKTTAEQIQRSMSAGISAADLFRDRGVKSMLGFKAGAVVTVEETAEAFQKIFGKGGKFGGATDQLAKTFEGTLSMIGDKFFNFKRTILEAGFFNGLKKEFGNLNKALEENSEIIDKLAVSIGTVLAIAVEKLADGFRFVKDNAKEIGIAFKVIISLKIATTFINIGRALIGVVATMRSLVALTGVGIPLVFASVAAGVGTFLLLGNEMDKIEKKINENHKEFKKTNDEINRGIALHGDYKGKVNETTEALKKQTEEVKKLKAASADLNSKLMSVFKDLKLHEKQGTIFDQIKTVNDKDLTNMQDKFERIRFTIATGISAGIKNMSDGIAKSLILGEKLSDTFKNMAQQLGIKIISALIEVIAKKSVELAIEKLITREKQKQAALSSASGFFGTIATVFGQKASGGAVAKGQPYMVGEQGAELFVPNQSGQIQQNARGGSGGGSTTVNFNINTVDARGFDELLTQSRGTITQLINQAVNERGAKSII